MALKVFHDGSEPGEPAENCCLCRAATRWWWGTGARNVALCQSCAKTAKKSDLPTKAEWCAKERQLNPRPYGWQPYGDPEMPHGANEMTDKTDALLALAKEIRDGLGNGATVSTRRRWAIEIEALAAPAEGGQGEVAEYQYRLPKASDYSWRRMSKQEYEATIKTGRVCGHYAGTYDVELRKLYTTPPAASVSGMTLGQRAVAFELLRCCESWEPGVRVMGNVKAGDAADLLRWLIDSAGGAKGGRHE